MKISSLGGLRFHTVVNLCSLRINFADAVPTPATSRRRTLCDASDLDALERRNLNDVLERRKLKHLASFLDTVPVVPSTRSSSASRSYSIGDADFGY